MSVEEYMKSGILEAYLLGELSPAELADVEAMAEKHPSIKEEMMVLEDTLVAIAEKTAIAPRDSLKDQILNSVHTEEAEATQGANQKIVPIKKKSGGIMRYMAAASITVALITSLFALNFWNKWKDAESRLNDLIAQNQRLAEEYNTATNRLEQTNQNLAIVTGNNFRKVVMNPAQPSGSLAAVYWNKRDQLVYLSITSLPELPSEKQYQLWALVDGQPLDAGVFDLPDDGTTLLKMKSQVAADAFAITLEPKGGSAVPTLEDLQVIGNV